MKFLVDNQLPAALARRLVSRGVECDHVLDLGLTAGTDAEIWEFASRNGYVVISKDEDFLYLASKSTSPARLVWVRIGNRPTTGYRESALAQGLNAPGASNSARCIALNGMTA